MHRTQRAKHLPRAWGAVNDDMEKEDVEAQAKCTSMTSMMMTSKKGSKETGKRRKL